MKTYKSFDFYMTNSLLSGICIACCLSFLVYLYVHHASSYRSRKIVSETRNVFSAIFLTTLIDYHSCVIDYISL